MGRGEGEEVRSRRPGVLTLTVKHKTEFFFHVNEKGDVQGEGTIEYNLEQDTSGLDSIVASVRSAMGVAGAVPGPATQAIGGAQEASGSLQYKAPHLKYGKEIRRFKVQGKMALFGSAETGWKLELFVEQVGDYTRPDGTVDNRLIAAWEVNRVKEEKPFPAWSPFLKARAQARQAPGGVWVVEFQEQGKNRNGVKAWQEYGYVWMARQIK